MSREITHGKRADDSRDHEDHLENALAEMNQQMEDLKSDLAAEKARLQRDNGRLQDLVSEINLKRTAEVDSFKSELARLEEETEEEIQTAKDQLTSMRLEVEVLMEVSHTANNMYLRLTSRTKPKLLVVYNTSNVNLLLRWMLTMICPLRRTDRLGPMRYKRNWTLNIPKSRPSNRP